MKPWRRKKPPGATLVRQHVTRFAGPRRGQLSGRIATTKRGKETNGLRAEAVLITANSPQGQIGPWYELKKEK